MKLNLGSLATVISTTAFSLVAACAQGEDLQGSGVSSSADSSGRLECKTTQKQYAWSEGASGLNIQYTNIKDEGNSFSVQVTGIERTSGQTRDWGEVELKLPDSQEKETNELLVYSGADGRLTLEETGEAEINFILKHKANSADSTPQVEAKIRCVGIVGDLFGAEGEDRLQNQAAELTEYDRFARCITSNACPGTEGCMITNDPAAPGRGKGLCILNTAEVYYHRTRCLGNHIYYKWQEEGKKFDDDLLRKAVQKLKKSEEAPPESSEHTTEDGKVVVNGQLNLTEQGPEPDTGCGTPNDLLNRQDSDGF